ncbi:MAG: hypothetical protein V7L02_11950 [Nostoc sp.]
MVGFLGLRPFRWRQRAGNSIPPARTALTFLDNSITGWRETARDRLGGDSVPTWPSLAIQPPN